MSSRDDSANSGSQPVGARFPRAAAQPTPPEREVQVPVVREVRASFDLAMRGYDRRQVDEHFAAAEDEIRTLRQQKDILERGLGEALARITKLTAQRDELRRREADSTVSPAPSDSADSDPYRPPGPVTDKLVRLARREAALVRANAAREAADILAAARVQAEAYRRDAEQSRGG